MTYPCRCLTRIKGVKCTQRKSLRKLPKDYVKGRQPKCPQCGKRNWYYERYRVRVEQAPGVTCGCGGLHFPHRKGCKFCYHHPDAEQDHSERYDKSTGAI